MQTEKLIEQLELYSNAVLGFMVVQSLGFSFTFGTDSRFSGIIAQEKTLACVLVLHFVVTAILSVLAIQFLSRHIQRLSQEELPLIQMLFNAKAFVVFLFAAIPVGVLIYFGIFK